MTLTFTTTTTHEFCKALKPYFSDLNMLPYNYHQPDMSVWWLSPSSAKPAYRFPKFAVLPPEADSPDSLFSGIYIEKGVDEIYAKSVGIAKTHTLDKDWAWHGLLADMATGDKLKRSIAQVRNATGSNPELRLYIPLQGFHC
ncbi:MAG: hypothetical protein WCP10_12775 [Desulfuromonadales bacterium]